MQRFGQFNFSFLKPEEGRLNDPKRCTNDCNPFENITIRRGRGIQIHYRVNAEKNVSSFKNHAVIQILYK